MCRGQSEKCRNSYYSVPPGGYQSAYHVARETDTTNYNTGCLWMCFRNIKEEEEGKKQ